MRFLVTRMALFLLPFVVYFAFVLLFPVVSPRKLTPWIALVIAGLVLVAGSFVWLGLTEGWTTNGRYVAAHVVDGKIVPGHVEKTP
jgi:uncharacterized membrane protein